MKEIKQIRIALANLEPLVDYVINKAQEIYNDLQLLQTKYDAACAKIEELKAIIENGRQDSNAEKTT